MVSYISAHGNTIGEKNRHSAKLIAISFFAGVTTGLLMLGTAAAFFGRLLVRWSANFAIATAAVSILAGLVALFGPFVRRLVPNPEIKKRGGVGGAFIYGLLFTVATITTSAGPLMLLLTIAAAVGKPVYGAALSLAYGVGRGLPFLLVGLFAGRIADWLARLERGRRIAEIVSGVALIAVGIYFVRLAMQIS